MVTLLPGRSGKACEVTNSTLLREEPDERSTAQSGNGKSDIASIVAGRALAIAAAQTMPVAIVSNRSLPRSPKGVLIPSAMLIGLSRSTSHSDHQRPSLTEMADL